MDYQNKIRSVHLSNGLRVLKIDLPDYMNAIVDLVGSDISTRENGERIIQLIDRVLNGDSEYEETRGNACRVEIKKEYTRVVNYLFEQLEDEKDVEYTIETAELKKIIQAWSIEIEKHRRENN